MRFSIVLLTCIGSLLVMSQTVTDTALETTFAAFMVAIAISRHIITPTNKSLSLNAWKLAEEVNGLKFGDSRDFRVYPDALAHGFSIFKKSLNLVTPVELSVNKPTSNKGSSVSSFGRLKERGTNISVKFVGLGAPELHTSRKALTNAISDIKDTLLDSLKTGDGDRDPDLCSASSVLDALENVGVQVVTSWGCASDKLDTTSPPASDVTRKFPKDKDPSTYTPRYMRMLAAEHLTIMAREYPGSTEDQKLAVLKAAQERLGKDILGKKRKRSVEEDCPASPPHNAASGAIDRIVQNMPGGNCDARTPEDAEADEAELYRLDCSEAIIADAEADGAYHPADEAEDAEDARAGANVPLKNNLQELAMDPAIKAAIKNTIPRYITYSEEEKENVLAVYDAVLPRLRVEGEMSILQAANTTAELLATHGSKGYSHLKGRTIANWVKQRAEPKLKTGKKVVQEFEADVWAEILPCVIDKQPTEVNRRDFYK
jgi:hypothetical protein